MGSSRSSSVGVSSLYSSGPVSGLDSHELHQLSEGPYLSYVDVCRFYPLLVSPPELVLSWHSGMSIVSVMRTTSRSRSDLVGISELGCD